MALWKPKISVDFICGYSPCSHEGQVSFEANDPRQFNTVLFCPECNIFNYRRKPSVIICPNCETELPKGCGGVFKKDGKSCFLNLKR